MTGAPVSVIVVSQHRPRLLLRTLLGLSQLDHLDFEVVVVADSAGIAAVKASRFAGRAKLIRQGDEGISAARNAGISAAAGQVVAFVDDDAVPVSGWLTHLVAPFEDASVTAATGYVRGRNGISFQSKGTRVDGCGWEIPVPDQGTGTLIVGSSPGDAVKTVGTNCAFRREELAEIGGFDPAIRFFMDETELNLRLAAKGARVALVPLAEVYHGFAPSPRRRANRLPLSLYEEAASTAILLRRHGQETDPEVQKKLRRNAQEQRLARHLIKGTAEPRDLGPLLCSFDAGWAEGLRRPLTDPVPIPDAAQPFLPFGTAAGKDKVFAGDWRQREPLRAAACSHVASGGRAHLFLFSKTTLFHHRRFTEDGVWEQTGGQFGKSDRTDPPVRIVGFKDRLRHEIARVFQDDGLAQELFMDVNK